MQLMQKKFVSWRDENFIIEIKLVLLDCEDEKRKTKRLVTQRMIYDHIKMNNLIAESHEVTF